MAERLNAHDSKSCYAGMYTRVQIPFSAPQKRICLWAYPFLFETVEIERDLRVGGVLQEQNGLPYENRYEENSLANWTIDNCPLGRAAKGANPFLCAKKKTGIFARLFFVIVCSFVCFLFSISI